MSSKEDVNSLPSDKSEVSETPKEAKQELTALSRKRTREDFEQEQKSDGDEDVVPQRPIAEIKRRKSSVVSEEETKKELAVIRSEALKEENDEDKEENNIEQPSEETKVDTVEKTQVEPSDDSEKSSLEQKKETVEAEVSTKEEKEEAEVKSDGLKEGTKAATETNVPIKDVQSSDKPESTKVESKPQETPAKSRFVFGATTPFGANAFSLIDKKKNVFDSPSISTPPATSSGSIFGSSSKFGNAFQSAIQKKSIFDNVDTEEFKEEKDDSRPKTSDSTESNTTTTSHMYKQVELEKKDIKSGEEDEEQVFTTRAKLYALDLTNVKEGWKERGVGTIHVNKSKEVGKSSRVIMRSIGLLKVILNTPLVAGLEVVKGMPSSLSSEKFIRITSVENGKPIQYALKTGNVETTLSLFESIEELIPKSV